MQEQQRVLSFASPHAQWVTHRLGKAKRNPLSSVVRQSHCGPAGSLASIRSATMSYTKHEHCLPHRLPTTNEAGNRTGSVKAGDLENNTRPSFCICFFKQNRHMSRTDPTDATGTPVATGNYKDRTPFWALTDRLATRIH